MEDQGKRLLLAVAIAFALLWVWNIIFPTEPPKEEPKTDEQAAVGSGSAAPADNTAGGTTVKPQDTVTPVERGEEVVERFEFEAFSAEFSSYGGAIKSWTLNREQFEDRRKNPAVPLELVPTNVDGPDYYTMQVALGEGPLAAMRSADWAVAERGDRHVTFRWSDADYEVTKKYVLDPELYLVDLKIDVVPKQKVETNLQLKVWLYGFQDPKEAVGGGMTRLPREWKAACLVGDTVKRRSAKDLVKESTPRDGDIRWGGFAHSYFAVAHALDKGTDRISCNSTPVTTLGRVGGMQVELIKPPVTVQGTPYQWHVVSYLGPKFVNSLEQASEKAGFSEGSPGFEEAIDLGFLSFISGPLLWLLTIFQSFVINWGLAIVCLTILIKLLLLPMTHKSIKSMKGMSKLKPQMEKLREKYADDKQKLQVETMNLFKTNGVNPAAGCLPMLLQMPIWFALYRMLMAAAELYQAPFIPGWIDDLTAPDPLYILPVSVTILMFFQTKLTPTTASGLQGKVLMYGMPLMFGFFSLFFPAGLTLYIFTNTSLTLVHYYFVHKEDRQKAKADKAKKQARKDAGLPEEDDDDEDDLDEDAEESKAKKAQPKAGPKAASNVEKRARKKGGSRGGKKGSKKKKKKKSGGPK